MAITKDEAIKKADEILKNFKKNDETNQSSNEMALSDIIDIAYNENKIFKISELEDLYVKILNSGLKDDKNLIKKFEKLVPISLANVLQCHRISYKGDKNQIIVDDNIYIKTKNSDLFFTSSSNGTIRTILNKIFNNNISSKAKDEIIRQISDLCNIIDFNDAMRYIKFKNAFVYDTKKQSIIGYIKDLFIIRNFDFDYDPNATCQTWFLLFFIIICFHFFHLIPLLSYESIGINSI